MYFFERQISLKFMEYVKTFESNFIRDCTQQYRHRLSLTTVISKTAN